MKLSLASAAVVRDNAAGGVDSLPQSRGDALLGIALCSGGGREVMDTYPTLNGPRESFS
jgi:hypothetical protein